MSKPKIVYFDLEIIPDLSKALEYWTELSRFPGKTLKATVSSICTVGYLVEGEMKKAKTINVWDKKSVWKKNVNDDYHLCKEIYEVLKDADAVVTYNGKRFDWPYLQTRLMYHNLPLLEKPRHVDLYMVVRNNFRNINNKLDTASHLFLEDRKLSHTGWKLWIDTHRRDPKAMELMAKYCRKDVDLMPKLLKKLRPLIKNLPNMNFFKSERQRLEAISVCPTCGSEEMIKWGNSYTATGLSPRFRCKSCGSTAKTSPTGKSMRPTSGR